MNLAYYSSALDNPVAEQKHSGRELIPFVSLLMLMRGLTTKVRDLFNKA